MHPEHRALLDALRQAARPMSLGQFDPAAYLGNDHLFLNVSVPDRRKIAKAWVAAHKAFPAEEVLEVVDSLFAGASHEEKTLAAILLACHPKARATAGPARVEAWLDHLVGWAEVDTLCQNVFTPEQMGADWPGWSGLLRRLAGDANSNKRRASLVLLACVVRRSPDPRFRDLAFETLDQLKSERPILITKAVSWLLRGMIAHHREAVGGFLDAEASSLPSLAVRETRAKLATGRKSRASQPSD